MMSFQTVSRIAKVQGRRGELLMNSTNNQNTSDISIWYISILEFRYPNEEEALTSIINYMKSIDSSLPFYIERFVGILLDGF